MKAPVFHASMLNPGILNEALITLFNDLQDTLFWIKDRDLRILAINPAFAERVNLPESEIIGKTDADIYFPELARTFIADDRHVLKTGEPLYHKFELLAYPFGGVEWRSTTKLPLRDRDGGILGTTGISRPLRNRDEPLPAPYAALARLVAFARQKLSDGVGVRDIAREAGMSVATLTRHFREHMRLAPGEFLAQMRISRACRRLAHSPMTVVEIAVDCGYESPSAFSRAFRRQMKLSPSAYRRLANQNGLPASTLPEPQGEPDSGA
jgi:AraC-like DNA-binding protein